jgi:Protein of unknown function (DUF3306)
MTMSEQGFLRRWARRKSELRTEGREGREPAPEPAPAPIPAPLPPAGMADAGAASRAAPQPAPMRGPQAATERPPPTMDDVATLDAGADFSAFVARGVDQAVRRSALKKLFADPHFNTMDGLDVYIDDYTRPSPVSEAMLAALDHAKSAFMTMIEDEDEDEQAAHTRQPPGQETQ